MQEILTQKSRDVKGSPRSQRKKMFQPSPSSRGPKIRKSSPSGNIRLKVVYGRRTKQKTSQISSSSVQLVDCSSDSNKLISGDNIPDSALAQKVDHSMDKLSQVSPFCLQGYGSEISAAFLNRVQNYCILGKDADFSIISKKAVQNLCISSPEMEVRKSTKTGTIVVNDEAISNTDSGVAFGNVSSEAIVSSENTRRLQRLPPTNTWVCSENGDKCKPAADVVLKTYCRRSCKDNHDKALADCPIRQEKSNAEINAVSSFLEVEEMEPVTDLFDDLLLTPLNVDDLAGISEALQANGGLDKPASYHQQEMPTETKTMEISSPYLVNLSWKLLKVLEFLAERDILTRERIIADPHRPGVKSLRELVLSLTEHEDRKVHQMSRSFQDKWVPRIRKSSCDDSGDRGFEMDRFMGSQATDGMKPAAKTSDSFDIDGSSSQANGCVTADVCARKRKSRWDQPADPFHLHEQNENKLEGRSPTNASTGKPPEEIHFTPSCSIWDSIFSHSGIWEAARETP